MSMLTSQLTFGAAVTLAALAAPAAACATDPPAVQASAAAPGTAAAPAAPAGNVVADGVRGIRVAEAPRNTAVLVVLVVDDAGDPLDEVAVSVLARGKQLETARSDSRGRAVFRLALAGVVSVRASAEGFVPATARTVALHKGGLTAVALPLEQREPQP
jgi:hypothetical protein